MAKAHKNVLIGLPKMFFAEKDFWEIISGLPQKSRSEFCGINIGLPQRFCVSKRFVGKGGTSAPNVVFAVRQTPEKSAL